MTEITVHNPQHRVRIRYKTILGVVAGAAALMYLTYGTLSPCEAVHHKARGIINQAMAAHIATQKDQPGAALGAMIGMKIIEAMPVEEAIDTRIANQFGSANACTCTLALFGFNWDDLRDSLKSDMKKSMP